MRAGLDINSSRQHALWKSIDLLTAVYMTDAQSPYRIGRNALRTLGCHQESESAHEIVVGPIKHQPFFMCRFLRLVPWLG